MTNYPSFDELVAQVVGDKESLTADALKKIFEAFRESLTKEDVDLGKVDNFSHEELISEFKNLLADATTEAKKYIDDAISKLGTSTPPVTTPPVVTPPVVTPPVVTPPEPTTPPVVTPTPTPTPEPSQSYLAGPTGKYYPSNTPALDQKADYEWESDCSWKAIGDLVTKAVNTTPKNSKVIISVVPGELGGNGSGSTSAPVLQNLGDLARDYKILIIPRDGYRSVRAKANARLHNLKNIAILGIDYSGFGLVGSSLQKFAIGKSEALTWNLSGVAGQTSDDIELVETVVPEARTLNGDSMAFRGVANGAITRVKVLGGYWAGTYRVPGGGAHADGLQLSGFVEDVELDGVAGFASTNSVYQVGSVKKLKVRNSLLVGSNNMLGRHPATPGGEAPSKANAINGGGQFDIIENTYIIGDVYGPAVVNEVKDAYCNQSDSPKPAKGSWKVDPGMSNWTEKEIGKLAPIPTPAYCEKIWKNLKRTVK